MPLTRRSPKEIPAAHHRAGRPEKQKTDPGQAGLGGNRLLHQSFALLDAALSSTHRVRHNASTLYKRALKFDETGRQLAQEVEKQSADA